MFSFMREQWFHGDINQTEAFDLLASKEVGSFLVRFSSNQNGLVISVVVPKAVGTEMKKEVIHIRVKHEPSRGFSIPGSDTYRSVKELLFANKSRFKIPTAAPSTKFDFLTVIPDTEHNQEYVVDW
jgi:hypothetical protein